MDDALLFLKTDVEQIKNLKDIFLMFEATLGILVSLQKSKMFGVGHVPLISSMADCFGCLRADLPASYLGLPFRQSIKLQLFGILSLSTWTSTLLCGNEGFYLKEVR